MGPTKSKKKNRRSGKGQVVDGDAPRSSRTSPPSDGVGWERRIGYLVLGTLASVMAVGQFVVTSSALVFLATAGLLLLVCVIVFVRPGKDSRSLVRGVAVLGALVSVMTIVVSAGRLLDSGGERDEARAVPPTHAPSSPTESNGSDPTVDVTATPPVFYPGTSYIPDDAKPLTDLKRQDQAGPVLENKDRNDINGMDFDYTIAIDAKCDDDEWDRWADYRWGGSYSRFQALVSISDAAHPNIRSLSYQIYLDGHRAASGTVDDGDPDRIDLSVVGKSQIRLLVESTDDCTMDTVYAKIVWADPLLIP